MNMQAFKTAIPQGLKNGYHLAQALVANIVFGFPGKKLRVIGVTGTNGKTTTVRLVSEILSRAGYTVARASTIDFKIGDREWTNTTKYTTLSVFAVQRFLRRALKAHCDYVVLETSSHALDQYRVWGIPYTVGVVTNITREHLDYHKTMAEYREAKRRLFDQTQIGVINLDMEDPEEFQCRFQGKCVTYSTLDPRATVLAEDIVMTLEGSSFTVNGTRFGLHLPGRFNIENALAAIAVGVSQNISMEVMREAIELVLGVPGRMESIANNRGLKIIIDYAVTPDSLEKLYELISKMQKGEKGRKSEMGERGERGKRSEKSEGGRIIAVFGACGDRDRGKRPIMGEIVASYANIIILTNEDPYYEDPQHIIREIARGIKGKRLGINYFRILDRRKALQKALRLAQPGDIVVVTGKGAEETMMIGGRMIPWNDRKVIEEILVTI